MIDEFKRLTKVSKANLNDDDAQVINKSYSYPPR